MKKTSIKKIVALVMSAAGLSALTAGAAGCVVKKSSDLTEPENIEITRLPAPDDGSLPTAHTCAENMAYLVSVFDGQTKYHTYSYGVTSASIATQTTRTFRDYKDGVLLTTDLTYSSMVKSGTQTCTVFNDEGEGEVYFRTSEVPGADTLPAEAEWHTDAPTHFSERAYHYTYGLLPTELFNYIVNEQNIIDSEELKVNSDGTYTQNFTLDPVASTYFYQFGMKTRGGLSGYPEFESITFSVTFDASWRILYSDMHEVAKVNKGVVVSSISDFTTRYWYGDDHFDDAHFNYYEDYYKAYIGDDDLEQGGSNDDKPVMDVTNILSNGFSQIMNGGAQFEIGANLGKNSYKGYVYLSLDLADPLETLALKLSLGKALNSQNFYLEYGDGDMQAYYGKDFALNANLAEVKLAAGKLGEAIEKIAASLNKSENAESTAVAASEEGEDPVTALMNSMVLVAGEKQAVLTLDTDDLLGLGIGLNARMVFGINNNEITFRGATVKDVSIGGEKLDLDLTLLTTTAPVISHDKSEAGANLADYISDVYSLLGADLIKVEASVHGSDDAVKISALKGVNADVTAYVDLSGITAGAEVKASYEYKGQTVSATVNAWYNYDGAGLGKAVVSLTDFNGAPAAITLKCDVSQLVDAVKTLLTTAGGDGGKATDGLVGVINGALSTNFSGLLTEMYADKASIKIGVSVDMLMDMFGVNAGVKFGSCTLKYARGEEVYGGELSAALPALGFNMSVSGADGEIETPDETNALDLVYVLEDIKALANAELFKLQLNLDGGAEGVTVSQLGGLNAGVTAYIDAKGGKVGADIDLAYTYGENTVSAKLTAWYGENKVALTLDEINNTAVSAKVYCDITEITEAVTTLLDYAGLQTAPFGGAGDTTSTLAGAITKILGADFAKLLPVLATTTEGLNLAVNMDEALALFGADLGVEFGNLSLAYQRSSETEDRDAALVASAPALGLSVNFGGADGELTAPDTEDYFDLTKLVNVVNGAIKEVNAIIENGAVAFEIEKGKTFLSLDGIEVNVWGNGEVCWKEGNEYVALDLAMSIAETGTDVTELKIVYDKNAVNTPLVRLALNEVGIDIYKEDIDGVIDGFNGIYNKVMPLFGKNGGVAAAMEAENEASEEQPLNTDRLVSLIFGVLSSDSWVGALNDFTLTCDGKSVALGYLADNAFNIEIGTDGALTLDYDGAFGERFTLGGSVSASADTGSLIGTIDAKLANCNMSSSRTQGSAAFVKLAYDFLFEAVSSIDVSDILGANTYTVMFELDGKNTNLTELQDVFIDAQIYFTGADEERGKLAEGYLNLDVKGVVIKLHVITERRGNNTHFYINLSQVMDTKLPDLKFLATQESLYQTFEVLFKTVNDTNILDMVGSLLSDGGESTEEEPDKSTAVKTPAITQAQLDKLTDILSKLLEFNFNSAVEATEIDGVMTANINLDNIVKQFGIQTDKLGSVKAVINHNDHSMKTSGKTDVIDENGNVKEKEWIWLSSERAERRSYEKFNRSDYISVEFLPSLIDDLVKTLTDDEGIMHNKFTLSGTINANLVSLLDVNIDNVTVTAGIDKEKGLSASIVMHVNSAKKLGIGIPEGTVGLTYQNGYITLAKGLDGASPKYKIMTLEYFVDHMLTKNDSVLQWWLDISGWSLVMSFVKTDINSGLTNTKDVYLYQAKEEKVEQEISMYDFVDALRVVLGGNQTAVFGNYEALENDLGVYDNYYGFALNAKQVTGGVLTKLNAAVTRNENGLDAIKASGAIDSLVTFSANLNYKENRTEEFVVGNKLGGEVTAPSLYDNALSMADAAGVSVDFEHFAKTKDGDEKFGCFSTDGMSTDYSVERYTYELTVLDENKQVKEVINVRSGSTVFLYDNNSPIYKDADRTVRILYSLDPENVGAAQFVMYQNATVYTILRNAVKVIVHNNEEEVTVNSYVGDRVPTTVKGLETLEAPTYKDGTTVGENDIIDGTSSEIHIYGLFVNSTVTVNYVVYTFNAQTLEYTVTGKAAGFNDKYSTQGETLVLESSIGGYPVTAIGAGALANTDGKPIVSVIVPDSITTVGELAFADNYGMKQVIFLADTVTFEGKDGSSKTMPFYGCSVLESEEKVGGKNGNEITDLHVYYNTIFTKESKVDWRHFRYVNKFATYNFYIGKNGGGDHGKGTWSMVDVEIIGAEVVDANDADFKALVNANVTTGLKTDGAYSAQNAAQLQTVLVNALSGFRNEIGGDKYVVMVTATEYAASRVMVSVKVVLNVPRKITVNSRIAMNYVVGSFAQPVAANVATSVYATEENGEIVLSTPSVDGYLFTGWTTSTVNGATVYTANWAQEFTLTLKLNRPAYKTDSVHVNADTFKISGHANPFSKQSTTVTDKITIYEGQATFVLSDNVLTITSYNKTYVIYVMDCEVNGTEKSKRSISSSLNNTVNITGNTTLTITY